MAWGPGCAACGLARDNLCRLRLSSTSRASGPPVLAAACRVLPGPLPPAVLPCLSVCHLPRVQCALLLKHLVLDNLWIIANSR